MFEARAAQAAGWNHADEQMFTRGSDVLFHVAGREHQHRWAAVRNKTGIKTRRCRDCSTVEIELRNGWTKVGS